MQKELKEKWLSALRSGNYKQGQYKLHSPDHKFCCLGVLCKVAELKCVFNPMHYGYAYNYKDAGFSGVLPTDFANEQKIDSIQSGKLINMNDEMNCDFNVIANWIEKHIPVDD